MEATQIQHIFTRYIALGSIMQLRDELFRDGYRAKPRRGDSPGNPFSVGQLTALLTNPIYTGQIRHKGQLYPGNHPAIVDDISWQQVQALRATAQETYKHRTRSKNPSLLAGVLFDAEGHPMSPSHSNNKGKRYRYYVSQDVIQGKPLQPDTLAKIPAGEMESCISHAIPSFLKDDIQIRAVIPNISPSQRCLARQIAAKWDHQRSHPILRKLLSRVDLYNDHICITLWLNQILQILNQTSESKLTFKIKIPITLKQIQGGATYLISDNPTPREPNPVLILAIAKATRWNQLIVTGQVPSLEKLAQQDNVRSSHIRTLIPLAWLAPDIVEAILKGEEPVGLTLGQLNAIKTADWPTQRHQLGFAA